MVRMDLVEPHPLPGLGMHTNSGEVLPVRQRSILMPLEFVVQSFQILLTRLLGGSDIPLPAVVKRVILVLVEHSVARPQPLELCHHLRVQLRKDSAAVSRGPFTTFLSRGLAVQGDVPRAPDGVELVVRFDGVVAMVVAGGADGIVHDRGGHGPSLNRTQISGLILEPPPDGLHEQPKISRALKRKSSEKDHTVLVQVFIHELPSDTSPLRDRQITLGREDLGEFFAGGRHEFRKPRVGPVRQERPPSNLHGLHWRRHRSPWPQHSRRQCTQPTGLDAGDHRQTRKHARQLI
mmetsp:Transcript_12583/g.30018  ORF Transcript_12583/g.30018 Transcript_12583/m.30018 type:complete len:292 (-) Transcript_12583:56-931(-)